MEHPKLRNPPPTPPGRGAVDLESDVRQRNTNSPPGRGEGWVWNCTNYFINSASLGVMASAQI